MGFGALLSATTRVRLDLGNNAYSPRVELDRAYVKAQLGFLAVEAGRDVLALGPSFRSALAVASHSAPADQLRAWTRPFALPFIDPDAFRMSLLYFLVRLRQPQYFDGTLLECTRMQLDLFKRVELGGSRLLQFGGRGAPKVDFGDYSSSTSGANTTRAALLWRTTGSPSTRRSPCRSWPEPGSTRRSPSRTRCSTLRS